MSDQPTQKPGQIKKAALSIAYPGADQVVLTQSYDPTAQTGTILVRGTGDASVKRMIACFQPPTGTFTMPATLLAGTVPSGCFELGEVGTSATFENTTSPVSGLPPTPPPGDNLRVFVGSYDNGGNLIDQTSRAFVAMPAVLLYAVNATHCIWLCYADPTTPPLQPFGETITPTYVPTAVLVPDGATQVRVEALSGTWRHDPADSEVSDYQGIAGTEQPLDPSHRTVYWNDTLHSSSIVTGIIRLNRLVALWAYGDPTVSTSEIDVVQTNQQTIPSGPAPVSLRLGFHDGYQWSNNSGAVQVRVTWLP